MHPNSHSHTCANTWLHTHTHTKPSVSEVLSNRKRIHTPQHTNHTLPQWEAGREQNHVRGSFILFYWFILYFCQIPALLSGHKREKSQNRKRKIQQPFIGISISRASWYQKGSTWVSRCVCGCVCVSVVTVERIFCFSGCKNMWRRKWNMQRTEGITEDGEVRPGRRKHHSNKFFISQQHREITKWSIWLTGGQPQLFHRTLTWLSSIQFCHMTRILIEWWRLW